MPEHYFTDLPASRAHVRDVAVSLAGREVTVSMASGVFSAGRVDLGTRVLLRRVEVDDAAGDLLDLGCGWGPIALSLGLQRPAATVWAVDVNERAVALTAANADRLALTNIRAVTPDRVPAGLRFDQLWSNPPIRIGKANLHELLGTWLPRLTDHGVAMLVVQRNLGADSLIGWMNQHLEGLIARKHSSAKGFRVIEVRRR